MKRVLVLQHIWGDEAIELLGQEGYDQIERERATRYPIYAEHTRILFENFLKIAELL